MPSSSSIADPITAVLVVDHAYIAGGQAKVAFDSALGLMQAGHHPIVFTAAGPVDPALASSGLDIRCLDQSDLVSNQSKATAAIQGVWNRRADEELAKILASAPPDRTIVHVHGWAKALSPSIARAIAASGLPAIYTMHEYFLFCPNGGFYNYQRGAVCTLKPMSAACLTTHCDSRNFARKMWRSARQLVVDHVARLADVFSDYITISDFQSQIVAPYLPRAAHVHRISNPIEAQPLGRKANPASGDFVFVGRISPEKGPFLFAEAAAQAGVQAVFVGDGPAADELRARFPAAKVLGWQTSISVQKHMREARALVFPSLWYEGQPLAVLEAKSVGSPVIVSDACAAREEIVDGVSGLWFKSGDASALASALRRAQDQDLLTAMSHAAYDAYWADPPTLETHVRKISDVYRAALTRARKPA